jgi:hypothetical protein
MGSFAVMTGHAGLCAECTCVTRAELVNDEKYADSLIPIMIL